MGLLVNKQEFTADGWDFSFDDNSKSIVKEFENKDDFIFTLRDEISKITNLNKTEINIALSGGSAIKIYPELLGEFPINFENVRFWQVDERLVPPDNPESNQGNIENYFINNINDKIAGFEKFNVDSKKVAEEYEERIKDMSLDLIILGIGPDGHIGSLFPYEKALHSDRLVELTFTQVFPVCHRVTLTFNKILEAKKILVLLTGSGKRQLLKKLKDPNINFEEFPAAKLLEHKDIKIFFIENLSVQEIKN